MSAVRIGNRGGARLAAIAAVVGLGMALVVGPRASAGPDKSADDGALVLHLRTRTPSRDRPFDHIIRTEIQRWDPKRTAVIICDMWNAHWCRGATARVNELAPAINRLAVAARARGAFIIHAPSDCMAAYKDHPARKRAQDAPRAAYHPKDITGWCSKIPSEERNFYPIDQADGGCDDSPTCPQGSPWKTQHAAIEIHDEDAVSDKGEEIWDLLEARGINNVLLMGVHLNMCVLGRPFGIRQLVRHGKNAVLVRDLTDTMYNSRSRPFVRHCVGTQLMVEHVEKSIAPTVLSTDITGAPAFHFQPAADAPRAVFLIGEDEYRTAETLPAFARDELAPLGIRRTMVIADPKRPHDFPCIGPLKDADLLVLSVRRRAPRADQMAAIRQYIEAGKPLIAVRTACHAFDTRGQAPPGHADWPRFGPDVLGGHYVNHYANDLHPAIARSFEGLEHKLLRGVEGPFRATGSLYRVSPLEPTAQPLLTGTVPGRPAEPVAWTNREGQARIFYTSLGAPGDFESPAFRQLLRNAFLWALEKPAASEGESPDASRGPGR